MSVTISQYIERDLAAQIGTDQVLPAPLTLHSLSRHYGVSPTPVREAIRHLLALGMLVRQSNGRLDVNRDTQRAARRKHPRIIGRSPTAPAGARPRERPRGRSHPSEPERSRGLPARRSHRPSVRRRADSDCARRSSSSPAAACSCTCHAAAGGFDRSTRPT